jgi:two-component system, OmpR family, phosphate regulon response regulator OmpR
MTTTASAPVAEIPDPQGFLVTAARDAAHARRLLAGLAFDLIVLDVMMPGEDGISLTALAARGIGGAGDPADRARRDRATASPGSRPAPTITCPSPSSRANWCCASTPSCAARPRPSPATMAPRLLMLGRLRYDIESGELRDGREPVRLTQTEAALMRIFAQPGQVISREALVDHLGRDRGRGEQRRRNARSMCRSPACAARSSPTRSARAICRPCAARATC